MTRISTTAVVALSVGCFLSCCTVATFGFVPPYHRHSSKHQHGQVQRIFMMKNHFDSDTTSTMDDNQRLVTMNQKLSDLQDASPDSLTSFFEPALLSFSVKPGTTDRISITSTCYSLLAILAGQDGTSNGNGSSNGDKNTYRSTTLTLAMDAKITKDQLKGNGDDNNNNDDGRQPVRSILQNLVLSPSLRLNKDDTDMFQVPVLLYTLLQVDKERSLLGGSGRSLSSSVLNNESMAARIRQLLSALLTARPRRRDGMERKYSDYITFHCARVYALLYSDDAGDSSSTMLPIRNDDNADADDDEEESAPDDLGDEDYFKPSVAGIAPNALPDGITSLLPLALMRCSETSANELSRQVALHYAGDTNYFDIMRLAYSLLTYVVSTNALAGKSAGRELVVGCIVVFKRMCFRRHHSFLSVVFLAFILQPGQGPSKGTKVLPVNQRLVAAALKVFFLEQNSNGLWDKGQPIYRSFRKTGRNVGNAFVFSVDTLCSLLEELPAQEFKPYLPNLQKTLDWLEFHQSVEILPDYCDPVTGQCFGKSIRGWASPHFSPEEGPAAWSTAQAIGCIARMKSTVETLRHDAVLAEFQGFALSQNGPTFDAWDRLLDSDLGSSDGAITTLKQVLEERMIYPRDTSGLAPSSSSSPLSSYSAILFGPPGTAKTTICESLARRIGWDFVVIDTSVFLADGLTNVASRIRYVFGQLQALRNCVILFDEIEEFCLDREAPGIGMESRMLTTAMLTAINDLRRAKRSIFFLATNRLRAFDAAITRPGRFDMQLFVGTPNLEARVIQLRQKLADVAAVPRPVQEEAVVAYREFLASVWDDGGAKYMVSASEFVRRWLPL
mmetsp:Transcript_1237/g.2525  ORF Transcript_1237/g.2525 Transcript_1237/m.2525 type:complete len:841 (+) Transcript_1237:169-2691(+)